MNTQLFSPLALARDMRELDRKTIEEYGLPGAVLMENAGRATVDAMEAQFGPVRGKGLIIFAGPGNNGGDGLVIARTVHNRGAFPLIFLLAEPEKLPPDAALNWRIIQALGLPHLLISPKAPALPTDWGDPPRLPLHSIVDALFGVGLQREIKGVFHDALNALQGLSTHFSCPVVAVDIPSGLDSDTGRILGKAAPASLTVTYGVAKPGLLHNGGAMTGRLVVADIGIPPKAVAEAGLSGMILDEKTRALVPVRVPDAHKGTNGHTLIVAGSSGKAGAALLAAKGALASGSGLVSCAVPEALYPLFAGALHEAMYELLPASPTHLALSSDEMLPRLCAGKRAIAAGPGLGTHEETEKLVLALYTKRPEAMVVDADALNILAKHKEALAQAAGPRVFTPHPGEMARLLDLRIEEIQSRRLAMAQKLCALCGRAFPVAVALKGAGTVVAANNGQWAINTSGNQGMAAGGMGDVLTGIIAGLIAQGLCVWEAACAGVWLHGAAADLLARKRPFGYTASEVAAALPRLLR